MEQNEITFKCFAFSHEMFALTLCLRVLVKVFQFELGLMLFY